jgi:hypothetical protein
MTVTYPIVEPTEGTELDPDWGSDITESANDHETRLGTLESPEWIDFTCTWSADTTAPTLSNTTRFARYYYVNSKQIQVVVRYEMGAGSAEGSGGYTFSLPVAAVSTTGKGATGIWIMNDSGASIRLGAAIIETTTTTLKLFTTTGAQLSSTVLTGTFTTSWLQFTITYEVA